MSNFLLMFELSIKYKNLKKHLIFLEGRGNTKWTRQIINSELDWQD